MCFEPDPFLLLNVSFKDDIGSSHVKRSLVLGSFAYHEHNEKAINFSSLLLKLSILHLSLNNSQYLELFFIMVNTWSWSSEWSGSDQLDGLDHLLNRTRWSSYQQRQQQGFLRSLPNQPGRLSPPGTRDISFDNFQLPPPMTWRCIKTFSLSTCVGLSSLLLIRT